MSGGAGMLIKSDGFESLVAGITREAGTEIDRQRPLVANAIRAIASQRSPAGEAITRISALVVQERLRVPHLRAIEAATAYWLTVAKIRRLFERSEAVFRSGSGNRDCAELDRLVDAWWWYTDRYLDAAKKLAHECSAGAGKAVPGVRRLGGDFRKWEEMRRKSIAKGRNEAAHANTTWIAGIDHGIWEPMALLGFFGRGFLGWHVRTRIAVSRRSVL